MATKDDILGGNASADDKKTPVPVETGNEYGRYETEFRKYNPDPLPTPEEDEKLRKKRKRDEIFAAIGDGVSALSNLFFTTQYAPNMYNNQNSMSERTRIRYDKLKKEREDKNKEYFWGLMKARQADETAADRERAWQRQLGLDQEARDRRKEEIEHRNEREKIADDRYNAEQEYRKARDKEADDRWNKTYNLNVRQHNDNVSVRREQVGASAARGVRGKQIGFSDGDGNQVAIYENVWKGSMQQVYDAMVADGVGKNRRKMTAREKDDFVKQNWHKSPKASAIMLSLSKLDPATMTSEFNDDVEDNDDDNTPPSMRK